VDLLCLDKTGTLTTNQLELSEAIPYDLVRMDRETLNAALGKFAASTSGKDRTITAILNAYPAQPHPVSEEVPFASEYKWSALRYETDPSGTAHILGAPDVLAGNISSKEEVMRQVEGWTAQGKRVLLFSSCSADASLNGADGLPHLPAELEPLGLIIFQEELRPNARQTLEHFSQLGVKIKFISGDHPATVAAQQVGVNCEGPSGLN
jgi:cation-transporting ATPase E